MLNTEMLELSKSDDTEKRLYLYIDPDIVEFQIWIYFEEYQRYIRLKKDLLYREDAENQIEMLLKEKWKMITL